MTDNLQDMAAREAEEMTTDLVPAGAENAPMGYATGIAAVALNMAMKWHDTGTIKDGAMYQALKAEGRNIPTLTLNDVLDTAKVLEAHLALASNRISEIVTDALKYAIETMPEAELGEAEEKPKPKRRRKKGTDSSQI